MNEAIRQFDLYINTHIDDQHMFIVKHNDNEFVIFDKAFNLFFSRLTKKHNLTVDEKNKLRVKFKNIILSQKQLIRLNTVTGRHRGYYI